MKYFKVFNTENEYLEYISSDEFISPNVSTLYDSTKTWITAEIHNYSNDYFTIKSLEDSNEVKLTRWGKTGNTEYYSLDSGNTWTQVPTGTSEITIATINSGETLMIKSEANEWASKWDSHNSLTCTKNYDVCGNIMSLIYGDDFRGKTEIKNPTSDDAGTFCALFWYTNDSGETAVGSTTLISAENLVLPATTLKKNAYNELFRGCTNLKYPPKKLPATTLADSCYSSMFDNCHSLLIAPNIKANEAATNSCNKMFRNCTCLTTAPELPATILANNCYNGMFVGCTSLTTAPELPATTLANNCYNGMFSGCTSLTTAPELHETTLASGCYRSMFTDCTNLTTAPELPATTLVNGCYSHMFYGCTSLIAAPELSAKTLANYCYYNMFYGCTSLIAAPELPATTLATECYLGMFNGCTSLTTAPELPATTLANNCYYSMFNGCTSLTTAPSVLPATTLASGCYRSMFSYCTSLTTAPELPATTLANSCYYSMFSYCTSLTTAPELPATTLATECYRNMFQGCSKLNYIKCLAIDISASNCTTYWVQGVSSSGLFVKNSKTENWERGINGIPNNWTVRNDTYVEVTGVTISDSAATVNKGNTYMLTANVLPSNADDQVVSWSTSDSNVATVDSNGVVSGIGCGDATITVTTHDGGYTATCNISVENHVTSVDLDAYLLYLSSGGTYQLEATVLPSDACDKSVTWSSSDVTIATVNSNGLVSGVTTGDAVVTVATVDGGLTKSCSVTVTEPQHATSVTLSDTAITISKGAMYTLTATVLPDDAADKSVIWSSSDSTIATVDSNGIVRGVESGDCTITVTTNDGGYTAQCNTNVVIPTATTLVIDGATSISAESCNYVAIADNSEDVTTRVMWSITNGSQYAAINPNNGNVTILNGASESTVTIQAIYGELTATTNVTLTYVSGATSETETESTTDIGGNTTTVTTTVTEYEDGSKVEASDTIVTDDVGNVIGSSKNNITTNADGSYEGVTTNYDANGDPTDGANVTGDTEGNVSTQTVVYDKSGNTVVTGYDIDTSGSESGKTFNHDGVNTDYYAFDVTHGFVLDFDFTIDLNNQPAEQDGNHHNVLNAKRADPSPWYGFQIRHTSDTGNTVFLGVQFSGSSNNNVALVETSTTGSVKTYNLRIVYDPTSTGTTFTCINTATQYTIFSSSSLFPDIDELKNLKVTIGYAVDGSGNPYRYSNITVHNFELKKLKNVANPTITCENNVVTIDCDTVGASVYYRLNLHGVYSAYTTSFTITADTVVQTYATYNGDTSDIIREDCKYGLEKPVISCDGEEVTITCVNTGVTIYYRLNESGDYSAYTTPIAITADTVVEAYSQLGEETSFVVKETCIARVSVTGVTLNENSITINRFETYTLSATVLPNNATNKNVTWSSSNVNVATVDSNGVVSSVASGSATITVTTVDGGFTAQCSVSVTNRYAYFTLVSLADNNTFTVKNGSTAARSLSYSLDDGTTWSSFSLATGATQTIATINSGDTIIMKGSNAQLANEYNKGCYFRGTQNYEVEGNISSLLNNNDTDTEITGGTFHFAQLFSGDTHLISAENLKVVSTTLYKSSFNGTFRSCTNLQKAPDLSIPTTLAQETYSSMFEGCTSLSQPPSVLSATTAELSSYKRMFCMSRSSKVTTQMTKSPIMIGNFGSETGVSKDYEVFKGNGSLTEVKCYWTNDSGSFNGLANWMTNVSSSGTFYKRSTQTFSLNSASGIPNGWNIVNDDTTGN